MTASHSYVIAEVAKGRTLQSIASDIGVSRERIRQIAAEHGLLSRNSPKRIASERADIEELLRSGIAYSVIAGLCNVPLSFVMKTARSTGERPTDRKRREKFKELSRLAAMVEAGVSIRQAAYSDRSLGNLLARHCAANGIVSKSGRWRDFSKRYEIISRGISEGLPWDEIAASISEAEGTHPKISTVVTWAQRHGFKRGRLRINNNRRRELVVALMRDHTAWHKIARRVSDVECRKITLSGIYVWARREGLITARRRYVTAQPICVERATKHAPEKIATICMMKGQKTAREIGLDHGLSRNAVIGIWHRHIQAAAQ